MLDPVPPKLLKEVLPEVIYPLLTIINLSLSLGYVPKTGWLFKLAVIKVILHPKMKMLSLITYPHVVPNP